jgi:hypothetical protein
MPKYSVIELGTSGEVKVWMIEDGKRLFVDRNANGDLTDDGPAIQPSNVRSIGAKSWDFNYLLDAITPASGPRHTSFDLRRWNYGDKEDSYGLSLSVEGKLPMYAGWFGTFWSAKHETAPVIHFHGPFTPRLLREKAFTLGPSRRRLSLAFINPAPDQGRIHGSASKPCLRNLVPKLIIEWPTAADGSPLRTSHELTERCCYWEFYTTAFEAPREAVAGKAKVSVQLPAGETPIVLQTTEFEVPVVAESKKSDPAR